MKKEVSKNEGEEKTTKTIDINGGEEDQKKKLRKGQH